jgi:hypothetical protein
VIRIKIPDELSESLSVAAIYSLARLPSTEALFIPIEVWPGWKLDAAHIQFVARIVLRFKKCLWCRMGRVHCCILPAADGETFESNLNSANRCAG